MLNRHAPTLLHQLQLKQRLKEFAKKEEEPVSAALKAEDKMQSFWHVLMPDGSLVPIEEFKFKGQVNLQKFWQYEIKKARAVTQMPPHVLLMKRLEIADYEPGSDPGNIRWYPKGRTRPQAGAAQSAGGPNRGRSHREDADGELTGWLSASSRPRLRAFGGLVIALCLKLLCRVEAFCGA